MSYETENYETGQGGYVLKDQMEKFTSYYSTYKEMSTSKDPIDFYDDLIKSLKEDREFSSYYNTIREQDGIFSEFFDLENKRKIEVLIKIYYFTRDQKDQLLKMTEIMKFEKEELTRRNEAIIKEKEESIKIRNECYKNDLNESRKIIENHKNEIEMLKFKINELKQNKRGTKEVVATFMDSDKEAQYQEEIEKLKITNESISKMKENFEKLSKEYMRKYEDLEQKYEHVLLTNNDLMERNKKLELLAKYEGKFTSSNHGINLDGIMMTEGHNDEVLEKKEDAGEYKGYMKVNLKPTRILSTVSRKPGVNFNPVNNDILIRDINTISNNILQKKEQNDPNQISTLLEFGSANYSSTLSDNDQNEMSYSRNQSYQYSNPGIDNVHNTHNTHNSEANESQYSDYANDKYVGAVENQDYDADSYNSFNFESRVADYGKKTNTIFKTDEFGTDNSVGGGGQGGYIPPVKVAGYIPPRAKNKFQYTKDDYPSEFTDDGDKYQYKNSNNSNNKDFASIDDYDYQTKQSMNNSNVNNFIAVNKQDTIDYATYDNSSNYYYEHGMDPK